MAREDMLHQATSEFKLWGLKFNLEHCGSGHIKLLWRASPDKEPRSHIIAKTASDWRGWMNERAALRRLFKADGLTLKEPEKTRPSPLAKALSLPEPVEKDSDQIRMLRAEVSDLTEMLLEMRDMWMSQIAPPLVPDETERRHAERRHDEIKPSVRSIKAIEHVSEGWCTTEDIARSMGLSKDITYRKLYHLTRGENPVIELNNGRWRKKTHLTVVPTMARQARHASL